MPSIWPPTPGPQTGGPGGTLTHCPHPRLPHGLCVRKGWTGGRFMGAWGASVLGAPADLPKVGRGPSNPQPPYTLRSQDKQDSPRGAAR